MNTKPIPSVLVLFGTVVVLVYLAAATGLMRNGGNAFLALVFAIGPVAIVGVLRIADQLSTDSNAETVRAGKVFLIIAFSFLTLMLVVQQTIVIQFDRFRAQAGGPAAAALVDSVFRGVNLVQLGMDVAFDIHYCVGVILFAAAMYRHRDFGRFLGAFGVLSAAGLLVLNLAAFPSVPAETGLVDLGPVTGIWWLLVIAQMARVRLRDRAARDDG